MPRRNYIWMAILLAMAAVLLLVWNQPRTSRHGGTGEFGSVERTYRLIREQYYKPVGANDLQQAAVRGMVSQLDDFSTYVPPSQARALTDRVLGAGQDLGLEWTLDETGLLVVGPRPNSPARQAGLFAGDRILAINEMPVKTLPRAKIRSLLAPPRGEDVTLQVLDADSGKQRTVTLTAEAYPVETVQGLYRDAKGRWQYRLNGEEGIYYVRIPEFCTDTAHQLANVLRSLGDLQGIVLDLRDNPGGMLADGVAVADLFLREGKIVHLRRRDAQQQTHRAHSDTPYASVPLVVLIDENTSSAAEIVAGALGANSRAVLLGRRTRGKGCVQTMIRLPDELGQINLTTAEFLLPPEESIQRRRHANTWGVEPQVTIKLNDEQAAAARKQRRRMCVLPRPVKKDAAGTTKPATQTAPPQQTRNADPQLMMARALLEKPGEMNSLLEALAKRNRRKQEAFLKKQAAQVKRADDEDAK